MESLNYKNSFKNQFSNMSSLTVYRTGQQQCQKGFHRGYEIRKFFLLHYVIKGKGVYYIENKKFPVSKGQAFLIYPGTKINYVADKEEPWEFCWVGFNGSDAQMLMQATPFSLEQPVATFTGQKIKNLILSIYNCRGEHPHEIIMMTARLYVLIAYLIGCTKKDFPDKQSKDRYVHQALEIIEHEYMSPELTIEDISNRTGVSRSHLYRAFIDMVGVPPVHYLTDQRIRMACTLLTGSTLSIKEVAYKVGFQDSMYFSKVFKQKMHKTPREYRKHPSSPTILNKTRT